jgi:16S rRNA (guanine966-N2)-methyltransferase
MRIIGGRHKGRRLRAPSGRRIRPTSDRLRETLFNMLAHEARALPAGAVVADLFAGTGALGLEALSRGADHVFLVDNHPASLALARANVALLGEGEAVSLLKADATRLPPARPPGPCDLLFLDPPYHSGLAGPAIAAALAGGWLAEGGLIVAELARDEAPPEGFAVLRERIVGDSRIVFLAPAEQALDIG